MQMIFDAIISILSLTMVGFYTWSLKGHFSSARMPDGAKIISVGVVVTTVFFLYLIWADEQLFWAQIAGLLFELAAAALFWWAIAASRKAHLRFAFDPELPHGIVSEGPYRSFRHPFYTSYLLFWSGWALASGSAWSALPVVFFAIVYIAAARGEEKKFEASPLAEQYRAYKGKTGFFTPRLGRD